MLCREVQNYIATAKGLPFFYIVGDEDNKTILEDFKQEGLSVVRMSDFCHKEDKYPSVDELIDCFHTSDVDHKNNKFVVIGLGEYLCLRGTQIADKELRRLKTTTLGNARVILLLRGISEQANRMVRDDNRIVEQQRVFFSENQSSGIGYSNIFRKEKSNEMNNYDLFRPDDVYCFIKSIHVNGLFGRLCRY